MRFDWAVRRLVSGVVPEGGILKVVHPRPGMQQRGGEEKKKREKRSGENLPTRRRAGAAETAGMSGVGGSIHAVLPPFIPLLRTLSPLLAHTLSLSLSLAHMPLRPVGVCIQETGIISTAS